MPIVKIRSDRRVTIPKSIFDEMGLQEGNFVEVTHSKKLITIKPKKSVCSEDTLTPEEEKIVEKGFNQLKQGEYVTWEELKHELNCGRLTRSPLHAPYKDQVHN